MVYEQMSSVVRALTTETEGNICLCVNQSFTMCPL